MLTHKYYLFINETRKNKTKTPRKAIDGCG